MNSIVPKSVFLQTAISQIVKSMDWFDVAAYCYCLIKDVIGRDNLTEENYISRYVAQSPQTPSPNPNISTQRRLVEIIREKALGTDGDPEGFQEALSSIASNLLDTEFVPYLDEEPNVSTAVWSLLVAIDSIYAESAFVMKHSKQRPLNRNAYELEVGVYLRFPLSGTARYLDDAGICRIPEEKLQNQLRALVFFEKGSRKRFPNIVRIPDTLNFDYVQGLLGITNQLAVLGQDAPSGLMAPRLRIGSCPFTSIRVAGFDCFSAMEFVRNEGSTFTLRYNESSDEYYDSVIEPALQAAIEHDCQVLIFPEMVFAPSFHRRLIESLKGSRNKGSLSLVVAGSTWDAEKKTNSSTFYDRDGNKLGVYFKKRPFVRRASEGNLVEDLSLPNDPDVLVDVPGTGRVIVSICKDIVSDPSEAFELIDAFNPNLVCIPAFSASVEGGFRLPMEVLAQRYLSISCMANYCAERNKTKPTELGYVCAPGHNATYHSSRASAKFETIEKGACSETCGKGGGISCLEVIDIDYTSESDSGFSPNISMEKISF